MTQLRPRETSKVLAGEEGSRRYPSNSPVPQATPAGYATTGTMRDHWGQGGDSQGQGSP